MELDQQQIRDRAVAWHVRLRDGDEADWDAFSDWLGENPRHAEAYDLVEAADFDIEPLLPKVVFHEAANDDGEATVPVGDPDVRAARGRRWFAGGLVAVASLAMAVLVLPTMGADRYVVHTGPGEQRIIALDSDTRVMMNGETTLQLDHKDARFAKLVDGEALFHVRHDEADPFTLQIGDNRVRDVGTIFNAVKAADGIRIAVSEGKVLYNPERERVALDAGQALVDPANGAAPRVETVAVDAVGSWQQGRFAYTGQPLSQVAADLGRSLGVRIAVDPAIAGRPFSGSIMLEGKGPDQIERLNHAIDVSITNGPAGWTMKPAPGVRR
jgi:transmembrane sensor